MDRAGGRGTARTHVAVDDPLPRVPVPNGRNTLDDVYHQRFHTVDDSLRRDVWLEVGRYLQRFVHPSARVLDIGSDVGLFLESLQAGEKVATDVRDMSARQPAGVRFIQSDSLALGDVLPHDHFDAVLMSNFLEHLPSGVHVIEQLRVAHQLLRRGGRVIILQPNIRLTGAAYWDFIDHKTALTERSLVEATTLAGFTTETLIKRFLPYTTKSRLPRSRWLVRTYLSIRPAWWLLGQQTLYVGRK